MPVTARRLGHLRQRAHFPVGLQIGVAFYLVVLQGYGPTIDMYTARSPSASCSNLVTFVVFTTIWLVMRPTLCAQPG
jgi:hypothetical protein